MPPLARSGPTGAGRRPDAAGDRAHFDGPDLPPEFQWLRTPHPERLFTLTGAGLAPERAGKPRQSWFEQALVARRQEHHAYRAATELRADPPNWQQAAGLTTYYNRHKFHAALLTRDAGQRVLTLMSCVGDWPGEALSFPMAPQPVPDGPVRLEVRVTGARQQFFWGAPGGAMHPLGPALDASVISDEGGRGEHANFTGAFVGMIAFDLTGQGRVADFARFEYHPGPEGAAA